MKERDSNETVRSILFKYFGLWLRLLLDFFYFILQNLSPERFQKLEIEADFVSLLSQFQQHFTTSFCANFLSPK